MWALCWCSHSRSVCPCLNWSRHTSQMNLRPQLWNATLERFFKASIVNWEEKAPDWMSSWPINCPLLCAVILSATRIKNTAIPKRYWQVLSQVGLIYCSMECEAPYASVSAWRTHLSMDATADIVLLYHHNWYVDQERFLVCPPRKAQCVCVAENSLLVRWMNMEPPMPHISPKAHASNPMELTNRFWKCQLKPPLELTRYHIMSSCLMTSEWLDAHDYLMKQWKERLDSGLGRSV